MSELLQEFVDSASQQLRVDHDAGVIRGVKLLGLDSRNGRRYRENALIEAIGLYEGAKVNINHPKGHPLSPRDYQDRLGVVRGVQFRAGEGLFGDLHFNPRHALSEQLVWDAEHAPQNVGMSHNVLARTTQHGSDTIVEAITKVQSIDLVADPATTNGLYEHVDGYEGSGTSGKCSEAGSVAYTIETITLEQLRQQRPELICEIEQAYDVQIDQVRRRLDEMVAKEEVSRRRERMNQLLQEFDLPLPESRDVAARRIVSDEFLESLMRASNDAELRSLVESRATLVRSASQWMVGRSTMTTKVKRSIDCTGSRWRRPRADRCGVCCCCPRSVATNQSIFNTQLLIFMQEIFIMANTMRWRYGDTCPVVLPVDSGTVIEIGDMVYLDADDAKPASAQTDQGTELSNQQLFHDLFAGVAMQASRAGDTQPIRVATTGVFEFDVLSTTLEVGDMLGSDENVAGVALLNQTVAKVTNPNAAVGRCAKRLNPAGTRVLVDVVSSVLKGGTQAIL